VSPLAPQQRIFKETLISAASGHKRTYLPSR
jgi:hypothetical protein